MIVINIITNNIIAIYKMSSLDAIQDFLTSH